jgi:hypothetical protein
MAVKKTTRAQCIRKSGHSWVKGSSTKAGYCRKRASRSRSRSRTTSRRRTRSRSRSKSSPIRYIYKAASPRRIYYTSYTTPSRSSPRRIVFPNRSSSPKGLFGIPRRGNVYQNPRTGATINCNIFGSKSGCESSGCSWSGSSCN